MGARDGAYKSYFSSDIVFGPRQKIMGSDPPSPDSAQLPVVPMSSAPPSAAPSSSSTSPAPPVAPASASFSPQESGKKKPRTFGPSRSVDNDDATPVQGILKDGRTPVRRKESQDFSRAEGGVDVVKFRESVKHNERMMRKGSTDFGALKRKGSADFGALKRKGSQDFGALKRKGSQDFGMLRRKESQDFTSSESRAASSGGANPNAGHNRKYVRSKTRDDVVKEKNPDHHKAFTRSKTRPESDLLGGPMSMNNLGDDLVSRGHGNRQRSFLFPSSRQPTIDETSRRASVVDPSIGEDGVVSFDGTESGEGNPSLVKQLSRSDSRNFSNLRSGSRILEDGEGDHRLLKTFLAPSSDNAQATDKPKLINPAPHSQLAAQLIHRGSHVLDQIATIVDAQDFTLGEDDDAAPMLASRLVRTKLLIWLFLEEPYISKAATTISLTMIILILVQFYYSLLWQNYDEKNGQWLPDLGGYHGGVGGALGSEHYHKLWGRMCCYTISLFSSIIVP